jgi:hypothetical protein
LVLMFDEDEKKDWGNYILWLIIKRIGKI